MTSKSWRFNVISVSFYVSPYLLKLCHWGLGLFFCVALPFSRSLPVLHILPEDGNKASTLNWGGGFYASGLQMVYIISFPGSLARTQPHGHIWGKLLLDWEENRVWWKSIVFLSPEWMLHWRGGSLLPSLIELEVALLPLVYWMRHLERQVYAQFWVREYVLPIVTKPHLEWLTEKRFIFLVS